MEIRYGEVAGMYGGGADGVGEVTVLEVGGVGGGGLYAAKDGVIGGGDGLLLVVGVVGRGDFGGDFEGGRGF